MKKYDVENEAKQIAKLFAIAAYRNSEMENVHHDYKISDSKMKELNKDICNRMYELFLIFSKADVDMLDKIRSWYISDFTIWDLPENEYHYASKEYYDEFLHRNK